MGALRYSPDCTSSGDEMFLTSLEKIDAQAIQAQQDRPPEDLGALGELLQAGSTIGGAKPKCVIFVDRDSSRFSLSPVEGFAPWVIKLSTIPANETDSREEGAVEYAYSLMARAAGIKMPETRIFPVRHELGERRLFGVMRFDRGEDGSRIHMQTYAALRHIMPSCFAGSYEGIARDILELTGDQSDVTELFRRCAFNVLAGNTDDHLKNFSFLMGEEGLWRLASAYDLTPGNATMTIKDPQSTSVAGTFRPGRSELLECAKTMGVKGREILDEVRAALSHWREFASEAGVNECLAAKIEACRIGDRC